MEADKHPSIDAIMGVVRHALTVGAGYFIGIGVVDEITATTIVSGIVAAIATGWSVAQKYK